MSKNNKLLQNMSVVYRIDFDDIKLGALKDFSKKIDPLFKSAGSKEAIEGSIQIGVDNGSLQRQETRSRVWMFKDTEHSMLMIGKNSFVLEYQKIKDLERMQESLKIAGLSFFEVFNVETIKRIGLRVIYQLSIDEPNKIDWSKYIQSHLIENINYINSKNQKLARAMTEQVIKINDYDLTMRYGIWNSDYPNEVVRKEFVLDYDCVSKYPIDAVDFNCLEYFKNFQKYVQDIHKTSIKNK